MQFSLQYNSVVGYTCLCTVVYVHKRTVSQTLHSTMRTSSSSYQVAMGFQAIQHKETIVCEVEMPSIKYVSRYGTSGYTSDTDLFKD